jgi:putative flippase GtrA
VGGRRRGGTHLRHRPGPLEALRARLAGRDLGRIVRYGATSVLALGISEVVLVAVTESTDLGGASSALLANIAGTVPSYLLSRYWIWPEADRRRVGRQVALYWVISLISMGLSSATIGLVADHVPRTRVLHVLLLGGAYLVVSFILWVAKYVSYRRLIFTAQTTSSTG